MLCCKYYNVVCYVIVYYVILCYVLSRIPAGQLASPQRHLLLNRLHVRENDQAEFGRLAEEAEPTSDGRLRKRSPPETGRRKGTLGGANLYTAAEMKLCV